MVTARSNAQSYIIKRPRLTKLLDESEARIILLCAPAGYGKTTLAREWVSTRAEPVAWYACGSESQDVVALASGLAECLHSAELLALNEVDISKIAADDHRRLAGALRRAIADRPGFLVLDDYQYAMRSSDSEELIASLVSQCGLRVVLTSRSRPSWETRRMEIYGEALFIGPDLLAFTDEEALAVLRSDEPLESADFIAQSRGWPAVVGLRARRGAVSQATSNSLLPSELFDFLVEDLFDETESCLRRVLFLLAIGADRNLDILEEIIPAVAEQLGAALDKGFVTRAGDAVELHPLIRSFLISRFRRLEKGTAEEVTTDFAIRLARLRRWDDCLEALIEFPTESVVSDAFAQALPDLLSAGRVATVERWLSLIRTQTDSPIVLVAESELALREGDVARALALAEHAGHLASESDIAAHAYVIAARAAHLIGDETASRLNADQARRLTSAGDAARVPALWLAYLRLLEANEPAEARRVVEQMEAEADTSATHGLRLRSARAFLAFEVDGNVRNADREVTLAHGLLHHVADPMVRTNFLNVAANIAVSGAAYERAFVLTDELIDDAQANGLDFVVDHGLITRAAALIGLRRLGPAGQLIRQLESRSASLSSFVRGLTALRRVALRVAAGDLASAATILRNPPPTLYPASTHGEWLGARALLLAALGDAAGAREASAEALEASSYVDAANLSALACAILELDANHNGGGQGHATAMVKRVIEDGHIDAVVLACRARPSLAQAVAADPELGQQLTMIFTASNDVDIGRSAGLQMPRELRRREKLTVREREIYELLVQGRTNLAIARTLFISESTVKVHMRHIYEKLGVRSRAEAAALREDVP